MSGVPILSLNIFFLQSSHPAQTALPSGIPQPEDFLHLDQYSQPAFGYISWSHIDWLEQFATLCPDAAIGTALSVLLRHARCFSLQPQTFCSILAAKASITRLHIWLPCLWPLQQSHQSLTLLAWDTQCTIRTFANFPQCYLSLHNLSTNSPSMGSLCSELSSNSSPLLSSSWSLQLLLSLSVLYSPPVQCLDDSMQCALPYGICSTPEYSCSNASCTPNYYHHSHHCYTMSSETSKTDSIYHSTSQALRTWLPPPNCIAAVTMLDGLSHSLQSPPLCRPGCGSCHTSTDWKSSNHDS